MKQTCYQHRLTHSRFSFVIHDGRCWLFIAQSASPKLHTYHLLYLSRKLEDRKKLSEGINWTFIVRKINVSTPVHRPIKWSLILSDTNKRSSGSTVIRKILSCKFRKYSLSGSRVVSCTKMHRWRFFRTRTSLKWHGSLQVSVTRLSLLRTKAVQYARSLGHTN